MKTIFKTVLTVLLFSAALESCRIRITPIPPPAEPTKIETGCQPPPIEKNIIGSWRFDSNHYPPGVLRTGSVTFTAENRIIDPDSLFENNIDIGSKLLKVIGKIYTTDGIYTSGVTGYNGKIFRVDLQVRNNESGTVWPFYVASNECSKIVIYQLAGYNQPVSKKYGFTLTR